VPLPAELLLAFLGGWACAILAGVIALRWLKAHQTQVLRWYMKRAAAQSAVSSTTSGSGSGSP
jgi:hypothetical protein